MSWVQPIPITAEAGKSGWTTASTSTLNVNGKILEKVIVFIESAAGSDVRIKITKDGTALIPSSGVITTVEGKNGDNIFGYINMSGYPITMDVMTEVKSSQTIQVQYQNMDSTNTYKALVILEFGILPLQNAQLR